MGVFALLLLLPWNVGVAGGFVKVVVAVVVQTFSVEISLNRFWTRVLWPGLIPPLLLEEVKTRVTSNE